MLRPAEAASLLGAEGGHSIDCSLGALRMREEAQHEEHHDADERQRHRQQHHEGHGPTLVLRREDQEDEDDRQSENRAAGDEAITLQRRGRAFVEEAESEDRRADGQRDEPGQ